MVCYITAECCSIDTRGRHIKRIFFWSRNLRDLISDGSDTGFRRAPKRQSRREIMLIFLGVLTILRQTLTELTMIIDGAIRRRVPLRDNSCARLALRPDMLPSNTQVGQHEKNANQCNSRRRVAHGDGRRPTPVRPQYRSTG